MPTNPVLRKLGLAPEDRALVIHADDIGNFQASLDAYRALLEVGLVSSASTMVSCAWFPATAAFCRERAGHPRLDMGVHLTLTSEFEGARWGPILAVDPASGLVDDEGYFHRTTAAVREKADPAAVRDELRAQIRRALDAGIDVTHLDSHMFTLLHPALVDIYVELALAFGLPPFLLRRPVREFYAYGMAPEDEAALLARVPRWEEMGLPLFDDATVMSLEDAQDRAGQLQRKLSELQPGLTYLIIHPMTDTPETRAGISTGDWPCRVADYQTFGDEDLLAFTRELGIQLIGWRALRNLLPGREGA